MPWQDRIYKARYIANDGKVFDFDTGNVARSTEKRTTAFSFPGINDNYIQQNGFGSRKYPLSCIFTGDDCDLVATTFESALINFGVGKLEHPLYGSFDVVPFGTVSRRDDLVTAANQAIVEVEFWTTTGVVYPTSTPSPKNEVFQSIEDFNRVAPDQYADTMLLDTARRQAELRGEVQATLSKVDSRLKKISESTLEVTKEVRAWQQTINTGLNTVVGNPVLLAQQMSNLIQAPARAVIGIRNRILSYANFLRDIFTSPSGLPSLATQVKSSLSAQVRLANDFRTADLSALNGIVAMALAAVETEYRTRPEAISVADAILSELDTLGAWREAQYAVFTQDKYGSRIEVLDDGRSWQAASQAVYRCAGYLVQLSVSLAAERILVLDRDRSIVDVAAQLYDAVDNETIDFLLSSNGFTGSQILELKRGTPVLWYPQ